MSRLVLAGLLTLIAAPVSAQLTGSTAATGSVSSATTGSGSSSSSLGIGLGSGSLSGSNTTGATSSLPDVGGTNFGQPGTPLGSQSSLSARINARAGITPPSRLNTRLATGSAGYAGGGASGNTSVSGLSAGTTLSNAGQPSGTALGRAN